MGTFYDAGRASKFGPLPTNRPPPFRDLPLLSETAASWFAGGTRVVRAIVGFEQSLEQMHVRYDFFVTGYVVMPEHVHLLVSEPKKALLATAMQALKLSVAVQRKERPFWQKRYYDFNVFTEKKTTALKSGLVPR